MNIPIPPIKIITTVRTDSPRWLIFLSKASTLESKTVVNKNANTNISITFDIYGQIIDRNHKAINPTAKR